MDARERAVDRLAQRLYGLTEMEREFPWGSLGEQSHAYWRNIACAIIDGRQLVAIHPALIDAVTDARANFAALRNESETDIVRWQKDGDACADAVADAEERLADAVLAQLRK